MELPARIAREARALEPREAWHSILDGFERNDLLTYASAIAFQVFFALIPLLLLALGLLGLFGLASVWSSNVAPELRPNVSPAAFQVIDSTVLKVLGAKQVFWATLGALIAIWKVSGAMRATMGVLSRVYGVDDGRSFRERMLVSLWLSSAVTVLLLAAVAVVQVVPRLVPSAPLTVAVWIVAAAILAAVVALVVRFAPAQDRPLAWVGFGTGLVIVGWLGASAIYGLYITSLADYGSIFGSLAVVIVTLSYLYLMAIVFLAGVQLDALIRRAIEQSDEPEEEDPRRALVARSVSTAP